MLRIYLLVWGLMSLVTLILYGMDKIKAKRHQWRIKESILLGCTFLFGSIGAFIGIHILRHKSRHWYFRVVCDVSLFIHIVVAVIILKNK